MERRPVPRRHRAARRCRWGPSTRIWHPRPALTTRGPAPGSVGPMRPDGLLGPGRSVEGDLEPAGHVANRGVERLAPLHAEGTHVRDVWIWRDGFESSAHRRWALRGSAMLRCPSPAGGTRPAWLAAYRTCPARTRRAPARSRRRQRRGRSSERRWPPAGAIAPEPGAEWPSNNRETAALPIQRS